MSAAFPLREALLQAIGFEAEGDPAGNVTVGRGRLDGRAVQVGLVDNRVASGAIGTVEAARLGPVLRRAAAERSPVVLFLDSAGAKVSEGLPALGAFRALYRAGLDALLAGAPIAAVLGRNCFGGSSMLAHLAERRLFDPVTRLAMSGPAVIASASGLDPLDEMFRAMADAALSAASRARASPANTVWTPTADIAAWLREALAAPGEAAAALRRRHEALAARLERPPVPPAWDRIQRADLAKLYPQGYEARERDGVFEGRGRRDGAEESFVGLAGRAALTAGRGWQFSDIAWRVAGERPERLQVFLDCAAHAARLDEERLVLTEYVVDMAFALAAAAAGGTHVELMVTGKGNGGVYVALAAPAAQVASLHGAEIQVLPGTAVAAILGESRDSVPSFEDYRAGGVAEREIKLGLVPGVR